MGNDLSVPVSSVYAESNFNKICSSYYSCVNGFRHRNEDAHACVEKNGTVFNGVFDGHSNEKCSQYVAENLPHFLLEDEKMTPHSIEMACLDFDKKIIEESIESGSTATFSIIKKEKDSYDVLIGNIGDSTTIVLDRDADYLVTHVTTEHKPSSEKETARIKKANGIVTNGRVDGLSVSRAFGDPKFKNPEQPLNSKVIALPDIKKLKCNDGDVIIHICDGITERDFPTVEVVQFIVENMKKYYNKDLSIVPQLVCLEALLRHSMDNLSCMIVVLGDSGKRALTKKIIPGPFNSQGKYFMEAYKKMGEMAGIEFSNLLSIRLGIVSKYLESSKNSDVINTSDYPYESDSEREVLEHSAIKVQLKNDLFEEKDIITYIQSGAVIDSY
jgi:protein phosphatase